MTEAIADNWPIVATVAALYAFGAWITWHAFALGDDPHRRSTIGEIAARLACTALWPAIVVLWTALHIVMAMVGA